MKSLVCKECGREFEFKRVKKYCSEECSKSASKKNRIKKNKERFGERYCEYCGEKFVPYREDGRFCKEECTLAYGRYVTQGWQPPEEKNCSICGKMFKVKSNYLQTYQEYCSLECTSIGTAKKSTCVVCGEIYLIAEGIDKKYCKSECKQIDYTKTCDICGEVFKAINITQRVCPKNECRKADKRQKFKDYFVSVKETNEFIIKTCKYCGKKFKTNYNASKRVYCLDSNCADKANREMHGGKVSKAKKNRILKREKYICKLCGQPLRMDKQDDLGVRRPHMLAPTVDHIVPVSLAIEMGWSRKEIHSESNLQSAHFICNVKKGNNLLVHQSVGV